jgi:hypothetical protein
MVLRTLPEANLINAWLQLGVAACGWEQPFACFNTGLKPGVSEFGLVGALAEPIARALIPLGCSREPPGFRAFVLIEEPDKLPAVRLFPCGDFENEILRHQIDRVTHLDEFLVLIDCFVLGANHASNYRDYIRAILGRLQKPLRTIQIE